MNKRYLRDQWTAPTPHDIKQGDYVVATKYRDGDPGDQFCIGFYDRSFDHYGTARHLVTDEHGKQFRHNGFRRISRIGRRRGIWMVNNLALIERMGDQFSVWHWVRAPWSELDASCCDGAVGGPDKVTNGGAADPRDPDHSRPGIFATHNCWKCKDGTDLSRCPTPDRPGNCGYPHARND